MGYELGDFSLLIEGKVGIFGCFGSSKEDGLVLNIRENVLEVVIRKWRIEG